MAEQIDQLRAAIEELTRTIKGGGGGGSVAGPRQPAKPTDNKPPSQSSKNPFEDLTRSMKGFAVSLLTVGSVLKGLSGTREGYQLDYSMSHLFYEIADMMRDPIRFITNELEGLARVMHAVNATADGQEPNRVANKYDAPKAAGEGGVMGVIKGTGWRAGGMDVEGSQEQFDARQARLSPYYDKFTQSEHPVSGKMRLPAFSKESKEWEKERVGARPADDHLQQIMHTSFGAVEGLQQKMQQLSTENPAQERGLSIMEQIAKAVLKMAYGQAEADRMIPDPMIKKDV